MFHATEQLKNLLTLDVPIAHKWINDQLISVAVNRLNPGDEIQVYAGELIPADGNVITGISRVDEQRLTGTKLQVPKQNNDYVLAGTTNLSAELRIRVSKKADNFQLNQIIRFLTKAQAPNPEAHQSIDKASVIFLLLITSAATISALYHGVTFGPSAAVISAISVLIVAFPYALNISAPYAFIVASSLGVKQGILFRNIQQLKQLARADKLVFSSSGTLTTGKHQVIKVEQWVESNRWQAAVKQIMLQSKHPLAESILPYLHKILPLQADFQYVNLGNTGIMATRDKFKLMIGTDEILKSHQVQIKKAHMRNLEPHHRRLWVVANKQIIARFDLKDQIRDNAHETIDTLRSLNLQLSLLKTGLSGANKAIAGALGISKLDSQLTKSTKKHTGKTALVGNGLTDSDELLSTADASIVLGSRENAAIGRGGINLMRQDIGLVYEAIQIAQKTDKLIRRNGLLSLGYNSVAIPLAMSGLINPVSAGLLATTISLSLLAHTHRLLSWQPTSVRSIFGSQKTKAQT
jgi:Cu+-exporting ATPase